MTTIYTNKLGYGEPTNGDASSDTVKELQNNLGITATGRYDKVTDTAVRNWQASIGSTPDAPGRSFLGPKQTAHMFPASSGYTIVDAGLPVISTAPALLAPWAIWNPIAGSPGLRPFTGDARKVTLHTTETTAKPNWAAKGSGLPHFTFDPASDELWQHLPLDIAAYTMGGDTHSPNSEAGINVQIEMIGYAAQTPSWPVVAYDNLRALLDWITEQLDIERAFPFTFKADGSTRQTWASFSTANGIVGHQHAPYNTHWDPGALDVSALYPDAPPVEPPVKYATKAELDALAVEVAALRAEIETLKAKDAAVEEGLQSMLDGLEEVD